MDHFGVTYTSERPDSFSLHRARKVKRQYSGGALPNPGQGGQPAPPTLPAFTHLSTIASLNNLGISFSSIYPFPPSADIASAIAGTAFSVANAFTVGVMMRRRCRSSALAVPHSLFPSRCTTPKEKCVSAR